MIARMHPLKIMIDLLDRCKVADEREGIHRERERMKREEERERERERGRNERAVERALDATLKTN